MKLTEASSVDILSVYGSITTLLSLQLYTIYELQMDQSNTSAEGKRSSQPEPQYDLWATINNLYFLDQNYKFHSPVRLEQLHAITQDLAGGQPVVIHGVQRIGKTRTFKSAAELLPGHTSHLDKVGAFLDVTEDKDVFIARIEATCKTLRGNIILCLDEFAALLDRQDEALVDIEHLRKKYSVTVAIISHLIHDEEKEEERRSMFERHGYNEYSLRPLTLQETTDFVQAYFSSAGITFSESTLRAIHEIGGGRMFDIRSVATAMALNAARLHEIPDSRIIDIPEDRYTPLELHHYTLGNHKASSAMIQSSNILRASPNIIQFMRLFIERKSIPLEEVERGTDPRIISQLLKAGYIRKNETAMTYEFNGELLRQMMIEKFTQK